jgi:hypothetical protein
MNLRAEGTLALLHAQPPTPTLPWMQLDPQQIELMRRGAHLSLDAEGELLHEGEPILHPGLHKLFQSGLDVHESGEAIVRIGAQWAYVQSEGPPFVVQRLRLTEPNAVLELNTGDVVEVPVTQLALDLHGDHELRVSLHMPGSLPVRVARFGRRAWHALADDLQLDDAGRLWLQLGQHRLAVQRS